MKTSQRNIIYLLGLFAFVIISWISSFFVTASFFEYASNHFCFEVSDVGAFGDSFGAVNALFSGLALSGLVFTIILQQRELSAQRDEFIAATRVQSCDAILRFLENEIDSCGSDELADLSKKRSEVVSILLDEHSRLVSQGGAVLEFRNGTGRNEVR